jgi:hypothetical protein
VLVLTGAIEAEREAGREIAIGVILDVTGMEMTTTEVTITGVDVTADLDQNLLARIDTIDLV